MSFDGGKPLAKSIDKGIKLALSCGNSAFLSRDELLIEDGEAFSIQADLKSRCSTSISDLNIEVWY